MDTHRHNEDLISHFVEYKNTLQTKYHLTGVAHRVAQMRTSFRYHIYAICIILKVSGKQGRPQLQVCPRLDGVYPS